MGGVNELKTIAEILAAVGRQGVSDVHLAVGMQVMFRVDGILQPLSDERLESCTMESILDKMLSEEQRQELVRVGELEFSYSVSEDSVPEGRRLRGNVFRQQGGYAMALRLLPFAIPTPQSLGLPETVVELVNRKKGLILVAGNSGSGKSTTIASLLNTIANQGTKTVLTLERPVEYLFSQTNSMVLQREIGSDSNSYANALRAALHQDADVIFVGELCDSETISLALKAAEMGHLVLSTLHTNSAETAINRMIDSFPAQQQPQIQTRLSGVLEGVVAQQLLPRQNAGGRVAAFEVFLANQAARSLIREGKLYQLASVLQSGRKEGLQRMDDAIYDLYMKSDISSETAVAYANDPDAMEENVRLF